MTHSLHLPHALTGRLTGPVARAARLLAAKRQERRRRACLDALDDHLRRDIGLPPRGSDLRRPGL